MADDTKKLGDSIYKDPLGKEEAIFVGAPEKEEEAIRKYKAQPEGQFRSIQGARWEAYKTESAIQSHAEYVVRNYKSFDSKDIKKARQILNQVNRETTPLRDDPLKKEIAIAIEQPDRFEVETEALKKKFPKGASRFDTIREQANLRANIEKENKKQRQLQKFKDEVVNPINGKKENKDTEQFYKIKEIASKERAKKEELKTIYSPTNITNTSLSTGIFIQQDPYLMGDTSKKTRMEKALLNPKVKKVREKISPVTNLLYYPVKATATVGEKVSGKIENKLDILATKTKDKDIKKVVGGLANDVGIIEQAFTSAKTKPIRGVVIPVAMAVATQGLSNAILRYSGKLGLYVGGTVGEYKGLKYASAFTTTAGYGLGGAYFGGVGIKAYFSEGEAREKVLGETVTEVISFGLGSKLMKTKTITQKPQVTYLPPEITVRVPSSRVEFAKTKEGAFSTAEAKALINYGDVAVIRKPDGSFQIIRGGTDVTNINIYESLIKSKGKAEFNYGRDTLTNVRDYSYVVEGGGFLTTGGKVQEVDIVGFGNIKGDTTNFLRSVTTKDLKPTKEIKNREGVTEAFYTGKEIADRNLIATDTNKPKKITYSESLTYGKGDDKTFSLGITKPKAEKVITERYNPDAYIYESPKGELSPIDFANNKIRTEGLTVNFQHGNKQSLGTYNYKTDTISLNPKLSGEKATIKGFDNSLSYQESVLKHELIHRQSLTKSEGVVLPREQATEYKLFLEPGRFVSKYSELQAGLRPSVFEGTIKNPQTKTFESMSEGRTLKELKKNYGRLNKEKNINHFEEVSSNDPNFIDVTPLTATKLNKLVESLPQYKTESAKQTKTIDIPPSKPKPKQRESIIDNGETELILKNPTLESPSIESSLISEVANVQAKKGYTKALDKVDVAIEKATVKKGSGVITELPIQYIDESTGNYKLELIEPEQYYPSRQLQDITKVDITPQVIMNEGLTAIQQPERIGKVAVSPLESINEGLVISQHKLLSQDEIYKNEGLTLIKQPGLVYGGKTYSETKRFTGNINVLKSINEGKSIGKYKLKTEQRAILKTKTIQEQKLKTELLTGLSLKLDIIPIREIIKRNPPTGRVGFPDFTEDLKDKFTVSVKRAGKFQPLAVGVGLSEAYFKGVALVGQSALASFKITEEGESKPGFFGLLGKNKFFRPSKAQAGVFVEKRKYRIDTPGELQEITFKSKKNKRGLF